MTHTMDIQVVEDASVIEAQERAQLDIQITTAKRFPRSVAKFKENALRLATIDQSTAESCFYALPRGRKTIKGPSVRLAEIVMSEWGNCHAAARVVEIGQKELRAQGVFRDLEKNTAVSIEVTRRITDSDGNRYGDDMITVTGNAACKIAYRNAVFTAVPKAFWNGIFEQVMRDAVGDVSNLADARREIVKYFARMGKREHDILRVLGREGLTDVDMDDIVTLRGLANAIREGDISVDEAFGLDDDSPAATASNEDLNARVQIDPESDQKKADAVHETDESVHESGEDVHDEDEPADDGTRLTRETEADDEPEPKPDPEPAVDESADEPEESSPPAQKEDTRQAESKQYLYLNELSMDAGMKPSELKKWTLDNWGVSPDRLNRSQMANAISQLEERTGKNDA